VAEHVFAVDGVGGEPFLHHGRVDVVVVAPALVAGVVGWVDEDAVDLSGVHGKQRLEGVEVVSVDDEVAVEGGSPIDFSASGTRGR
jgi:hypothetical protein